MHSGSPVVIQQNLDIKSGCKCKRYIYIISLLISVWLSTGVILQARCVVAAWQAVRPVGGMPPTASAVMNLSSYMRTSVWRSVLQHTLSRTGSANTAPQPVRSATHSGSAQVHEHKVNQNKLCC